MHKKFTNIQILTLFLSLMMSASLFAQEKASPPKIAKATVNGNDITISYSSPSVKGRTIWGDLVPYDKVWRTGANEATTLEVSKDCTIGGKALKAGKYSLFTIPTKDSWTVIVNSDAAQWGAYKYDDKKDVLRFTAMTSPNAKTEQMTFNILADGSVDLFWDELKVSFSIK